MKHPLRNIAKGTGIVLFGIIISKFLGYLYRIIIARLGPEAYGELSLGLAGFGILSIVSILGLDMGVLRYISIYKSKNQNEQIKGTITFAMKTTVTIAIILGILLFIFANQISTFFFHTENITILIKIIAFALPFEAMRVIAVNTFKAFSKIQYDVYTRILTENTLKIILTLIFIQLGLSVTGAILAFTLSIIISTIFSLTILQTKVFKLTNKIKSICKRKEVLLYSIPLLFNSLTIMIITWIDTLMLGFFRTTAEVGVYNAAIPTAKLILILPTAMIGLFIPTISEYLDNKTQLKRLFYITTKWLLIINLFFISMAIIFSQNILNILFGSQYIAGYIALTILISGYFINGLVYTSRDILMLLKKSKIILIATLIGGTLNIMLNYYLIPIYGFNGAAVATAISLIVLSLILFIKTRIETKIKLINLKLIKVFIVGALSALTTYYIITKITIQNEILLIITGTIIMLIIYPIALYITNSFEKQDTTIMKTIRNKLK